MKEKLDGSDNQFQRMSALFLTPGRKSEIQRKLLDWYDREGRELPWRFHPRQRPAGKLQDPYAVWLSEVMLQQTSVAVVKSRFESFIVKWPGVKELASAADEDVMAEWAGLGYYARARNLLSCARVVSERFGGEFPSEAKILKTLPGIGDYTAAAIAAIAFDQPEAPVDVNIERVIARLCAVEQCFPKAKKMVRTLAECLLPAQRTGDWSQALMDLGARVCRPKTPACASCPLQRSCAAHSKGIATRIPIKAAKPARTLRRGTLFVGRREDGAWLLERRPQFGLLGGMLGWPWLDESVEPTPPCGGDWKDVGEVQHSLTHFELRLRVKVSCLSQNAKPLRGQFVTSERFVESSLPTLMRKALMLAEDYGEREGSICLDNGRLQL